MRNNVLGTVAAIVMYDVKHACNSDLPFSVRVTFVFKALNLYIQYWKEIIDNLKKYNQWIRIENKYYECITSSAVMKKNHGNKIMVPSI